MSRIVRQGCLIKTITLKSLREGSIQIFNLLFGVDSLSCSRYSDIVLGKAFLLCKIFSSVLLTGFKLEVV